MLFVCLFCDRTSSLGVLDATSVAGKEACLRRTWKCIKNRAKICVDAKLGSKASQDRKQAESQNANWVLL